MPDNYSDYYDNFFGDDTSDYGDSGALDLSISEGYESQIPDWASNEYTGADPTITAGDFSTPDATIGSILGKLGSSALSTLKGLATKADGSIDWAKLAALGTAAYAASNAGSNKATGYQGSIPTLSATRAAINYNDPNRVAGSSGRQYFTPATYVAPADLAAARTTSAEQAAGIIAGYTPNTQQTSREDVYNAYATTPGAQKNPTQSAVDYWQRSGLGAFKQAVANNTPAAPPPPAPVVARMPWEPVAPAAASTTTPTTPVTPLATPRAEDLAMNQTQNLAHGGIAGRYLQGNTDGMADKLPANIDGKQPAKLSHGEFVIPADVVSHLGNGNSEAGANKLYDMMAKVRKARTGNEKQGKEINPNNFMPGGDVKGYAGGGVIGFEVGGTIPPATTGKQESLSAWAGPYVTGMLGQGQAIANQPYQAYQGPLTAGESGLQSQAFAGIGGLTVPSALGQATQTAGDVASKAGQMQYTPTQFTSGTFGTAEANKYMNPYIQSALNPQLEELKRQADITKAADASRMMKAGAYGGGRQAILEAEGNRNLLGKQNEAIGTGYASAYDKAMAQFNADQTRQLQAQTGTEGSRQFGASFGMKGLEQQLGAAQAQSQLGTAEQSAGLANLNAQLTAGTAQRGITSEGIAADKKQFEEERDDPYKKLLFQQSLLSGLPLASQSYTTTPQTALQAATGAITDTGGFIAELKKAGII